MSGPKGMPDEIGANTQAGLPATEAPDGYALQQRAADNTYLHYMKPKFARAPIKEAGRVAYLGESSNLSLLVQDKHGTTDVVHYPLPENVRGARARVNELDNVEIDILHQRGAFLLPPRALCDELVDAYFQWIAPVVPVINRSKFMRRYRDSKNPPSLLLLQAILLAGSRVCSNPQLMDANGSTTPAAMTFYKRAKALYDANYEDDRVTIVQALILLAWWWEGPEGMCLVHVRSGILILACWSCIVYFAEQLRARLLLTLHPLGTFGSTLCSYYILLQTAHGYHSKPLLTIYSQVSTRACLAIL